MSNVKVEIDSENIQLGDHVRLGESLKRSWKNHTFAKNNFSVETVQQLEQIKKQFRSVVVMKQPPEASAIPEEADNSESQVPSTEEWQAINTPSELLRDVFDSDACVSEKSKVVMEQSSRLVADLYATELTETSVKAVAESIQGMVGNIIADSDVSHELLRITSHDYYTYTHSVNVGLKAILFAKDYLQTDDKALMEELGVAFFLHDAGKAGVSPDILNKPGKLNDDEWNLMRKHPELGVEYLKATNSLTKERKIIVLQHHEKIDGSGYPYGLKGDQFHLFGQICALADIFDALTAKRSYKNGMSNFEALMLMKEKMSHHFDPKILMAFIRLFC